MLNLEQLESKIYQSSNLKNQALLKLKKSAIEFIDDKIQINQFPTFDIYTKKRIQLLKKFVNNYTKNPTKIELEHFKYTTEIDQKYSKN